MSDEEDVFDMKPTRSGKRPPVKTKATQNRHRVRKRVNSKARDMNQIVRFIGYADQHAAAEPVLHPGEFVQLVTDWGDGSFTALAAGERAGDTLFQSEFQPVTSDADIAAAVATVVPEARAQGATSLREIAVNLRRIGIPTPSNCSGPWTATMVRRALERARADAKMAEVLASIRRILGEDGPAAAGARYLH